MLRRSLALAAVLCLACGIATAQTFSGVLSGSWWDPARSGEGQFITFETVGTRNVAYFAWFTYNASGGASWLVGNADYTPGSTSISIPVFSGAGARFGDAFRSGDVQIAAAGTVVLQYVSCTQLRMTYTGAQSFTLTLSRLVGPLAGTTCVSAPVAPSATDNALRPLLSSASQTGDARAGRRIPSIDEPLPQLGKLLFFSKALSGIQEKLRARPNDPILLYMQADVLAEQDPRPGSPEFTTALNSAKRAVSLRPSLGPAHTVLAKLYMMADRYPEAVAECRKALQDDPADQTALYHLVRALRKTDAKSEIPSLLKQLALLRQQAANKKREENRFKIVEGEPESQ